MAVKRKKSVDPAVFWVEVQREAIIRDVAAIRIAPLDAGVAVSFVSKKDASEDYALIEGDSGPAFLRHVEDAATRVSLPEGDLAFDIEPGAAGVLTMILAVFEAEQEAARMRELTSPAEEQALVTDSDLGDSAIIELANEIMTNAVDRSVSVIEVVPRSSGEMGEIVFDGQRDRQLDAKLMPPLLRRFLIMAGMAFTAKTDGKIRFLAPSGKPSAWRLGRRTASAEEPLRMERVELEESRPAAAAGARTFPGTAVASVHSPVLKETDAGWGIVESELHFPPAFAPGLKGLSAFTHCVVVFWMDRSTFEPKDLVRRPRDREDLAPVGIFAQRAKHRPNPIGVSAVKIEKVDVEKGILRVQGLDAIDGTPVLDVKPYVPAFDRVEHPRVPEWVDSILKGYF